MRISRCRELTQDEANRVGEDTPLMGIFASPKDKPEYRYPTSRVSDDAKSHEGFCCTDFGEAEEQRKMLVKASLSFAFAVLVIPHEPNIGLGRPGFFKPLSELALAHTQLLSRLDQVRNDIDDDSTER